MKTEKIVFRVTEQMKKDAEKLCGERYINMSILMTQLLAKELKKSKESK
ncbi:hypothetical protein Q3258_16840 [Clostridioides difficile]